MWAKVTIAVLWLLFFPIIGTLAQSEAPHGGGEVCLPMTPQAAAAAGCRFIGSERVATTSPPISACSIFRNARR